jgi:hypothetical protein
MFAGTHILPTNMSQYFASTPKFSAETQNVYRYELLVLPVHIHRLPVRVNILQAHLNFLPRHRMFTGTGYLSCRYAYIACQYASVFHKGPYCLPVRIITYSRYECGVKTAVGTPVLLGAMYSVAATLWNFLKTVAGSSTGSQGQVFAGPSVH